MSRSGRRSRPVHQVRAETYDTSTETDDTPTGTCDSRPGTCDSRTGTYDSRTGTCDSRAGTCDTPTGRGTAVARIVLATDDRYDQLVAAGVIRPAKRPFDVAHLPAPAANPTGRTSDQWLADLRGER